MTISVHLADFPDLSGIADEAELVADMDRVRDLCNSALAVRDRENIRIRQPLACLTVYGENAERLAEYRDIIADELNVKDIVFSGELEAVAERKLQVNFPVAGKRLGAKMKQVAAAAKKGEWDLSGDVAVLAGEELVLGEECVLLLEAKAGIAGAQALSTNDALVVLDLEITPELAAEGLARDLVRLVQQARKDADLNVSDRINLVIDTEDRLKQAIAANENYIKEQTLAVALDFSTTSSQPHTTTASLGEAEVTFGFGVV